MPQTELARLAGVSVGCLQGLETNTRATRDTNLAKIAQAIGLTVEALLHDEGPTDAAPDPRLAELRDEDLEVARRFHHASTAIRVRVLRALATKLDATMQLAERLEALDEEGRRAISALIDDVQAAADEHGVQHARRKTDPPTK